MKCNIKKLAVITIGTFFFSFSSFSNEDISLKVTSLSNVSGNGSIEACGVAKHKEGKTLLVTLKHDVSYYTTLTSPGDKWCVLFKRWTFSGRVSVSAEPLIKETQEDKDEINKIISVDLSELN